MFSSIKSDVACILIQTGIQGSDFLSPGVFRHKSLQPISKEPDRKGLHIPGAILDPKVFLF